MKGHVVCEVAKVKEKGRGRWVGEKKKRDTKIIFQDGDNRGGQGHCERGVVIKNDTRSVSISQVW